MYHQSGGFTVTTEGNNVDTVLQVAFPIEMVLTPRVLLGSTNGLGGVQTLAWRAHSFSTTGFTAEVRKSTPGSLLCYMTYMAVPAV